MASQFTRPPVCPQCNADASEDFLILHSGVNLHGQGFVHQAWAGLRAQFTPDQARAHALRLLEAAEAAESDQCVLALLEKDIGLDRNRAVQIIGTLRQYRNS
jgi:hypothetical protein